MVSGTGGIQFNGDTAAANALDDYEEGTWNDWLQNRINSCVNSWLKSLIWVAVAKNGHMLVQTKEQCGIRNIQ
jgi:hypothetical protein